MSNFMQQVEALYQSPEAVEKRRLRRARKQQELFDHISTELRGRPRHAAMIDEVADFRKKAAQDPMIRSETGPELDPEELERLREGTEWELEYQQGKRQAGSGWDLREDPEGAYKIGGQHPGIAAVLLVRKALSEFDIPTPMNLRYAGMKRVTGKPPYHIGDGHIMVRAELMSLSSVRHWVDIPVVVKSGRMLHPAVLLHNASPRVITQHTLDDILKQGDVMVQDPPRRTMYSPPNEHKVKRPRVPAVQPGLFSALPGRAHIRAALVGRRTAAPEHRDRAEMPADESLPCGREITLSNDVEVRDRGGVVYTLSSGTKGTIVRDIEGDNRRYYVNFPSEGFRAPIFAEDIAR